VRIAVAADHNGLDLKSQLSSWLTTLGHEVIDRGSHGTDVVDYPRLCLDVCSLVVAGDADWGLVIGGSGQGELIVCNKVRGIRAGLGHSMFAAEISRGNNDANVLVLGAKIVTADVAREIVAVWIATPFKGGIHQSRVDQITALDG
jgi:ribose 5-phosphate isomerase B